ncbi:MAG: polyphosphate kinase 2 family protein [Candidatus Eisenbacteria bacterium]|uniref:Polyphosphate kinase 2 family protein n=1 Tax=Eiseniibacteriota bacterium TaxID=2212470 RepID=A0A849SFA0_UNCEI|nr:polyphosphate kinase 2 family protein [Candidatus Eisenbacteria bacterium]
MRVRPKGAPLAGRKSDDTPGCDDKKRAGALLEANRARLELLQNRLHAESRRSLLVVLQGMDTSGKDGAIRHALTAFNPLGCYAYAFGVPSEVERSHDFLWRIHQVVPAAGEVAIFNRSHYEDVLVVRVKELVPRAVWSRRYDAINAFEHELAERGTTVLKFFLHISREEQRERLLARVHDPEKHWKFREGDLEDRERWSEFRAAYSDALARCNTAWAPWYVIPADRKWYRDLAISQIVADALERMDPRTPAVTLDVPRLEKRLAP